MLSVFTKYLCISEHKRLVNTIRSHLRPIYLGSWSEKFWSTELEACYDCFWPSQSNTHTAARHRLHAYPRMVRHINDMQSFAFVTINLTIRWNFSSWKCMLDVADEVSKHKIDKDVVYYGRHLNGHSRHYRQTIMLSTFADAGWNSGTCMHQIRFTYDSYLHVLLLIEFAKYWLNSLDQVQY